MKLPPALAKRSNIFLLSAFDAPQPQVSPKVIVPRQSSETRSPLCPSNLYLILPPWNSLWLGFSSKGAFFGREQVSVSALILSYLSRVFDLTTFCVQTC